MSRAAEGMHSYTEREDHHDGTRLAIAGAGIAVGQCRNTRGNARADDCDLGNRPGVGNAGNARTEKGLHA